VNGILRFIKGIETNHFEIAAPALSTASEHDKIPF